MISLYFHIPFCLKKCNYCSFNSFPIKDFSEEKLEDYFNALSVEIESYSQILESNKISTVYFGGGTPSIVNVKFFEKIIERIQRFDFISYPEITIEVNPATVFPEKLKDFYEVGINRISIGIQSFNNEILNFLGRIHNREQAIETIENVSEIFKNFSVDIIFAVPNQKISDLEDDLNLIIETEVPHVSCYSLSIEPDTDFYTRGMKEVNEDIFLKMYLKICEMLKSKGFIHYEISNFALKSFESKHNLNYWNRNEYLGFGAGAHSFFSGIRRSNFKNVEDYIESIRNCGKAIAWEEFLTLLDIENEFVFLSLRKKEGLDLQSFKELFKKDFEKVYETKIGLLVKSGLIVKKKNKIFLTEKGFAVSNAIFTEFIKI